jgi:hypothetical protein
MATYRAEKKSMFSTNGKISKDGVSFASMTYKSWVTGGTITVGERSLRVNKSGGWTSRVWVLCDAHGATVGKITRPKAVTRLFEVTAGGRIWYMKQLSTLGMSVVTEGAKPGEPGAKEVGRMTPHSTLSNKLDAVFTDEHMPEDVRMLCIWMMYLKQREDNASIRAST